ncbi:hypothetical protein [Kitasatospora purpeofusca]|uniref:hypothetical protein n=1 Tax=Kitasatospora purpeofusca TaxID=67352 RepID=UPI00382DB152
MASLFPLAVNTITNGLRALRGVGKQPCIIGIHRNQWEAEAANGSTVSVDHIRQAVLKVLEPLRTVSGAATAPLFLCRPRSTAYDQASTGHATQALTAMAASGPYRLLDAANATSATGTPLYRPTGSPNFGIFTDAKHYTADVHKWFADQ